ncbi:hypothetical protein EV182_004081 [Spiromyces aspiralis]|uniref:Uncharacterized protein n=1 Tax=Spiromyces aspiralis TaxID=68401 RepID=A0ACC1HQY0_9FUNG|nr:hypothetical protein EV182_004081 [Spiromyces aspiralis]
MASHRLDETIAQLQLLFAPDLRRTTILVWLIWALVSLGFTMFNSFLPKMLELHGQGASSSSSSSGDGDGETLAVGMDRSKVYRDALLYALSGIPGSIIGSWAVDTMLGRRYSMALATFGSAICLWVFSRTQSSWGVLVSSAMFGLVSALMYAIVYSYTPEVFSPAVRGTGCGVASALSRVAGIIAPLLAGLLIAWSLVSVLYASMAILVVAGICMVLLPIETAKHDAL